MVDLIKRNLYIIFNVIMYFLDFIVCYTRVNCDYLSTFFIMISYFNGLKLIYLLTRKFNNLNIIFVLLLFIFDILSS